MTLPIHLLPPDAQEDFAKLSTKAVDSFGAVNRHYSGHTDKGLAFRFFINDKYNKQKSEATKTPLNPYGVEIFDQVEMIEIFVDRKTRLHLKVDDKIKYKYAEEYKRFRDGQEAPGTSLAKWGVVPSNEVATFAKAGIFSVEQLALKSADMIQGKFPKQFFEHFVRAQQFVAAKSGRVEVEKQAEAMVELQKNYARLETELRRMQQEREIILDTAPTLKKGRGRPKKIIESTEDFNENTI